MGNKESAKRTNKAVDSFSSNLRNLTGHSRGILLVHKGSKSHISLRFVADVSGKSVSGGLSGEGSGRGVNVGDVNLHRSVVLGRDEPAGVGALAGHVHVNVLSVLVLHVVFLGAGKRGRTGKKGGEMVVS